VDTISYMKSELNTLRRDRDMLSVQVSNLEVERDLYKVMVEEVVGALYDT
jgi:hypothetical protein